MGGVQSFLIRTVLLSRQQPNKLSTAALLFVCSVCVCVWMRGIRLRLDNVVPLSFPLSMTAAAGGQVLGVWRTLHC